MKKLFKVYLVNTSSIGTLCGYGVGCTREKAIEAALKKAREEKGDPNAYYSGGQVMFSDRLYC